MADAPQISTLGDLKASGYRPRSVKDEIRANLIARLQSGDDVFPGILGFDRTVIPQVQNALLGRHDFILLGLRGQAKSRIVRMLPTLLDEWVPEVEGSEIHDDPLDPVSKYARDLIHDQGDETPVSWLHRSARYGEKLATPDRFDETHVQAACLEFTADLLNLEDGCLAASEHPGDRAALQTWYWGARIPGQPGS